MLPQRTAMAIISIFLTESKLAKGCLSSVVPSSAGCSAGRPVGTVRPSTRISSGGSRGLRGSNSIRSIHRKPEVFRKHPSRSGVQPWVPVDRTRQSAYLRHQARGKKPRRRTLQGGGRNVFFSRDNQKVYIKLLVKCLHFFLCGT